MVMTMTNQCGGEHVAVAAVSGVLQAQIANGREVIQPAKQRSCENKRDTKSRCQGVRKVSLTSEEIDLGLKQRLVLSFLCSVLRRPCFC